MSKQAIRILAAQKQLSAALLAATGSLEALPMISSAGINCALAIVSAIDAESRTPPPRSPVRKARGRVKK